MTLSNPFQEFDDTLDKTNQSLRSFELLRIKIRMLVSISLLIYKHFLGISKIHDLAQFGTTLGRFGSLEGVATL